MLQIWGYVPFGHSDAACRLDPGTIDGSLVTAGVNVTTEESSWPAWIVHSLADRSLDDAGRLEIRLAPTGRVGLQGEHVAGVAHGYLRDTVAAPGGTLKDLSVTIAAAAPPVPPATVEGWVARGVPVVRGTIAGAIAFEDSRGRAIRCQQVYWSLQPAEPFFPLAAQGGRLDRSHWHAPSYIAFVHRGGTNGGMDGRTQHDSRIHRQHQHVRQRQGR